MDRIYALIRGSAVNNDGRSGDFMATPSKAGQKEMLRRAYRNAGIEPSEVSYIEAHGTGTKAGDPVELGAIGEVCSPGRPSTVPIYVGSAKTNIGHTEGSAGVAGLIKSALALYHRQIPASLHVEKRNPDIDWDGHNLDIPQTLIPWPESKLPVAGVSAFGITGTNAHIVLTASSEQINLNAELEWPLVLPLTAQVPDALRDNVAAYLGRLESAPASEAANLLFTAANRSSHLEERLAIVANDKEELIGQLAAFAAGENVPGNVTGQVTSDSQPKVVFVFPGQGSQWLGMGRELLASEPVFRQSLEACATAMQPFVDWSLLEQLGLEADDPKYGLNRIDVIQPALLAIEIGLAQLWQSWGVQPDAVLGHSMGEVGAAYIAGALSLQDAMAIICLRSQLMSRTSGQGAMAMVELTIDQAKERLVGYEASLSIAVSNSPRSTVVAGDPTTLDQLLETLKADSVFSRKVKVDVASHSPQMEPLQAELKAGLANISPRRAQTPIYSTSQARISNGVDLDAQYWADNLRQPVQFSQMVQQLMAEEFTLFIEMSPHPILLPAILQAGQHNEQEPITIASLRQNKPEKATILASFGQVWANGYPVDWRQHYQTGQMVCLPAYAWQREHFWLEPANPVASRVQIDHPFWERLHSTGHRWPSL